MLFDIDDADASSSDELEQEEKLHKAIEARSEQSVVRVDGGLWRGALIPDLSLIAERWVVFSQHILHPSYRVGQNE